MKENIQLVKKSSILISLIGILLFSDVSSISTVIAAEQHNKYFYNSNGLHLTEKHGRPLNQNCQQAFKQGEGKNLKKKSPLEIFESLIGKLMGYSPEVKRFLERPVNLDFRQPHWFETVFFNLLIYYHHSGKFKGDAQYSQVIMAKKKTRFLYNLKQALDFPADGEPTIIIPNHQEGATETIGNTAFLHALRNDLMVVIKRSLGENTYHVAPYVVSIDNKNYVKSVNKLKEQLARNLDLPQKKRDELEKKIKLLEYKRSEQLRYNEASLDRILQHIKSGGSLLVYLAGHVADLNPTKKEDQPYLEMIKDGSGEIVIPDHPWKGQLMLQIRDMLIKERLSNPHFDIKVVPMLNTVANTYEFYENGRSGKIRDLAFVKSLLAKNQTVPQHLGSTYSFADLIDQAAQNGGENRDQALIHEARKLVENMYSEEIQNGKLNQDMSNLLPLDSVLESDDDSIYRVPGRFR